jgi:hypothetical protein
LCGGSLTDAAPAPTAPLPDAPEGAITARPPVDTRITDQPPVSQPRREEPTTDNPAVVALGLLLLLGILGLISANALGVALLVVFTIFPALFRMMCFTGASKRPLTPVDHVVYFVASLGVVTVLGVAGFVAFFVTCFVISFGGLAFSNSLSALNWSFPLGIVVGLVPGILVLVFLGRKLWIRKR